VSWPGNDVLQAIRSTSAHRHRHPLSRCQQKSSASHHRYIHQPIPPHHSLKLETRTRPEPSKRTTSTFSLTSQHQSPRASHLLRFFLDHKSRLSRIHPTHITSGSSTEAVTTLLIHPHLLFDKHQRSTNPCIALHRSSRQQHTPHSPVLSTLSQFSNSSA
jgi:hypothetical protein